MLFKVVFAVAKAIIKKFWLENSKILFLIARAECDFEKLKILKISVVLSAAAAMGT